jgi:hypothetical protein
MNANVPKHTTACSSDTLEWTSKQVNSLQYETGDSAEWNTSACLPALNTTARHYDPVQMWIGEDVAPLIPVVSYDSKHTDGSIQSEISRTHIDITDDLFLCILTNVKFKSWSSE